MNYTRRIAATILLIVMVPALVIAAIPVRYCIGPSGHQALEFVVDGIAHGGNHASHRTSTQDALDCDGANGADLFADEGRCTDKPLMDTASAPPPPVDLELLPLTHLLAQAPIALAVLSLSHLNQNSLSPSRRQLQVDPRVDLRRTVVLLI